jgi:HAD superfamily hydrolase (TIGR01509 family)
MLPRPPPLLAVIFDVDGTLAENESAGHREAFNRCFAEAGMDWHWDRATYAGLLARVAGGKERILHYARQVSDTIPVTGNHLAWVTKLHRRKSEIYTDIVHSGNISLRPGIRRLIAELRSAGVRLAIATTTAPSSLQCLVQRHFEMSADSLFEAIGAGDCVPHKKPAPDVYLKVLGLLRLPAENCLAIEDSAIGLQAARAAGIPCLITASEFSSGDDFTGALSVLTDLGEAETPPRTLGGQTLTRSCVDLEQLRAWHTHQFDL